MSSIMKGLVDEQDIEETKKLSAQEKFKRSMARAGYDMDAGAKRLQDLLAKQKKEREELEKKEKEIKEGPAVDAYMAGKSPAIAHFADRLDNIKEDETLQFATEVTPKVSPYAGVKDNKFRGAIGEGIKQMFENPNESPTDSGYQQGGWRKMNEQEVSEDLRKWFKEKWVRFGPDGKIRGACARGDDSEGKPKCLPQAKAHALGKKGRKYAAAKKRREDPNPERSGPAKNVATKKKSNESLKEFAPNYSDDGNGASRDIDKLREKIYSLLMNQLANVEGDPQDIAMAAMEVADDIASASEFVDFTKLPKWVEMVLNKVQGVAEAQDLEESFDQPYKLKWYPGDMDEVTAYAEIPNGDDLSIMFNLDANEEGEEAWAVEFYRNDSQEVTGEGDAQRIFATVLSAIKTFIKKYKPNRITFSASKDNWAKQQQGSYSRANLYDRLVQRYASTMGYKAFRADTGDKVIYELSKIAKQVAEGLINEKIAEGIVYATGPRSHGINDVDLIFKNLRTKKIVASVLGNNDHGIYEIKIDQNGLKPQSPINFVATGNPQDGSGEHVVYKLSSNRGNDAKEFSTMRNGFDTRNNTYYGMKMDFIGDDDYWSFLENMIGDIMWEDDAIEAGYVDRLDNGDLVFVKNQGVAEGAEHNNLTADKIFFARSNKTPKGWSYDHVGFITQDGKQIQMSGHKGNDVYVTNSVTDDPKFPKQNIKIVSLSKPVSVPTTNSVGAENCGTFVANVLQANGIKGIDTQKIYSVFKQPQKQGVAEGFSDISGLLSASNLNKSFIITAELAEGDKKKFRVKAQNERVAMEKFKKHHSMAKIINVKEEGVEEGSKYPRNPASYHLKKYPVPQDQLARPIKKEPKKPEQKPEEKLDELKCWPGYTRVKGVPAGAPGSCKKKKTVKEDVVKDFLFKVAKQGRPGIITAILNSPQHPAHKTVDDIYLKAIEKGLNPRMDMARIEDFVMNGLKKMFGMPITERQQCPECGGNMYEVSLMNEKKDACYYKVKSRYKVWPSAYASGALVKCRKKGAKNWGTKTEGQIYSTGGGAVEAQRWYRPKDNLGETSSNILVGILKAKE